MSRVKLFSVLAVLALSPLRSLAQGPPEPPAAEASHRELTVRVTLPTVVGLVGEYVGILSSREKGKVRALTTRGRSRSTSNPVLTISIPLPKAWSDSKAKRNP